MNDLAILYLLLEEDDDTEIYLDESFED